MMNMMLENQFILGKDPYPSWFRGLKGLVFDIEEDTGALISVTIPQLRNTVTARAGDIIGLVNKEVVVIPVSAQKFMS